jgi:hypothetical protein
MFVDDVERRHETLAPFLIEVVDRLTQPLDRLREVVAFRDQLLPARLDFREFLVRT